MRARGLVAAAALALAGACVSPDAELGVAAGEGAGGGGRAGGSIPVTVAMGSTTPGAGSSRSSTVGSEPGSPPPSGGQAAGAPVGPSNSDTGPATTGPAATEPRPAPTGPGASGSGGAGRQSTATTAPALQPRDGPTVRMAVSLGPFDPQKTVGKGGITLEATVKLLTYTPSTSVYTVSASNDSPIPLAGFRAVMKADDVLSASAKDGICREKGGEILCEFGPLAPGQSVSLDLTALGSIEPAVRFEAVDADGDLFTGQISATVGVQGG